MGSAGGIGSAEVVVREGRKLEGRGKRKRAAIGFGWSRNRKI